MSRSIAGPAAQALADLQDLDLLVVELEGLVAESRLPATGPAASVLEELSRARIGLLEGLPESWRHRYESVSGRHGRALSPVRDHTCPGCYMRLPVGMALNPGNALRVTRCEGCGRLLLWGCGPGGSPVPTRAHGA